MSAPPFAYYGGKTTLADRIVALLPEHRHYVEPFAGSLAVLLAKPRCFMETANDIDGDLVTFWRVLRDQPDDLARAAMLTPYSRAEFEQARNLDGISDLERARRVWVRLTQSRSASMKQTGWKFQIDPASRNVPAADNAVAFARRIEGVAQRLRMVALENRDAIDVIRDYGKSADVCIYADPPYLGSTRASNYGHELTSVEDHEALALALHQVKASVVISGYASPLYQTLFCGWHTTQIRGATTQSGDTDRVEVLWSNRPLREDLFSEVTA
jgi:DNA adenine methylase